MQGQTSSWQTKQSSCPNLTLYTDDPDNSEPSQTVVNLGGSIIHTWVLVSQNCFIFVCSYVKKWSFIDNKKIVKKTKIKEFHRNLMSAQNVLLLLREQQLAWKYKSSPLWIHEKRQGSWPKLVCLLTAWLSTRTWFSFADDSMKAAFQDSANAFPSSQLITLK